MVEPEMYAPIVTTLPPVPPSPFQSMTTNQSAFYPELSPQLSVQLIDELCSQLYMEDDDLTSEIREIRTQPRVFCAERHQAGDNNEASTSDRYGLVSKWRQKEKLKTTAVALVLCLNIGVDPPDVVKISPCARLECWVDPLSMQPAKALETIGKGLQTQYERWQPRAKYKMHLDPTVDDVRKLCNVSRKTAKGERVLFHYNGHGVPRPTHNGEIWVFNSRYTQYIPLPLYELQNWLGTPAIYVLDCSAAGLIINHLKQIMEHRTRDPAFMAGPGGMSAAYGMPALQGVSGGSTATPSPDPMKELIVLAACGANELLPQNPELPADVFTACLTTPITVALRWFWSRSLLSRGAVKADMIDKIPGRQTDRKTPLGELNWIFTAITDTIAWNVLPRALFQKLFRQDLLVASLFRNFLLAERIMSAAGCNPVSLPRLPSTAQHPMWQAWDMAAELCLQQLPAMLDKRAEFRAEFQPSPFFSQQLTAFENWLAHGSKDKRPPEQLPIVLQVLLSQVHRLRALVLLGRFLDMGSWAVDLALSVGIFPYVLKLLQTTSQDLRNTLVFIWCKILAIDKSCQVDLIKDSGHLYFIKYLDSAEARMQCRAQAAFVLAVICDTHPRAQAACYQNGLVTVCLKYLQLHSQSVVQPGAILLIRWLCLCLGKLCEDSPEISHHALLEGTLAVLPIFLQSPKPEIRASATFALGCLISSHLAPDSAHAGSAGPAGRTPQEPDRASLERNAIAKVLFLVYDGSALVRGEFAVALARFIVGHISMFQEAVHARERAITEQRLRLAIGRSSSDVPSAQSMPVPNAGSVIDGAPQAHSYSSNDTATSHPHVLHSAEDGCQNDSVKCSSNSSRGSGPASDSSPANKQLAAELDQQQQAEQWAQERGTGASTPEPPHNPHMASPDRMAGGGQHPDACVTLDSPSHTMMNLYTDIVNAAMLLASDPSPKVARLGAVALALGGCELTPALSPPASVSQSVQPSSNSFTSGSTSASSFQSANTTLGFPLKFKPKSWRSMSMPSAPKGPGLSGLGSVTSTPCPSMPSSPSRELHPGAACRSPYILKSIYSTHETHSTSSSAVSSPRPSGSSFTEVNGPEPRINSSSRAGLAPNGSPAPGAIPPPTLPLTPTLASIWSPLYKMSCEYFSRPMLEPQASAWRETEGNMPAVKPERVQKRQREMEECRARCRQCTFPKLKEQVHTLDTGADSVTAITFHPFYHNLLISADNKGYIHVQEYTMSGSSGSASSTVKNVFHVTGQDPTPGGSNPAVVSLYQLNELYCSTLLVGTADGAARVWRSYVPIGGALPPGSKGQGLLAAAWQAVPLLPTPMAVHRPAVYDWNSLLMRLYSSGGTCPEVVNIWDVSCETCVRQLQVAGATTGSASGTGASSSPIDHLSCASVDPHLVLAACADCTVRVFDIRAPGPSSIAFNPFPEDPWPIAGAILEPCGREHRVVVASTKSAVKFLDLRMPVVGATDAVLAAGSTALDSFCSLQRLVDAHSKTDLRALTCHPSAPVLATASSNSVKVWTDGGEYGSGMHTKATNTPHKMGPIACLAFHPYQMLLCAGGVDGICSVYSVENAPYPSVPRASTPPV